MPSPGEPYPGIPGEIDISDISIDILSDPDNIEIQTNSNIIQRNGNTMKIIPKTGIEPTGCIGVIECDDTGDCKPIGSEICY